MAILRTLRPAAAIALFAALALSAACQTLPKVAPAANQNPWWKYGVIYEMYPRSFQDSNGDGVGDLQGIVQRLDYLKGLGVDAIWLTPIYPSPQADFGYDISDYTAIDPMYGTMADFDRLVAEAKKRNMRVLMDLVLNHTSDRHPWFVESASSAASPKRDWYIWRDGRTKPDGTVGPPNNWVNRIEQSAWLFDPKTRQYVYHYYAPEQPDLNWRNPAVKTAMFDVARFWLDRGVDGFRLDAINTLFEEESLRDAPAVPGTNEYGEPSLSMVYQRNMPGVHEVLHDLRALSDTYPGSRVLVGEIYTKSTAELAAWYGAKQDELQLPMDTNVGFANQLDAATFRKLLEEAETSFSNPATPLFVFDNHDRPRSWDRYGDGRHNVEIAKMLAAILLATRSSSLIYQGQELGMETITPTRKEDVRDPRGIAGWPAEKGRDGERTPMQWDATHNAGFTASPTPWLPVEASSTTKNIATESKDPQSLLNWYRALVRLKRDNPTLHSGRTVYLNHDAEHVLAWVRQQQGSAPVVVLCNMSASPVTLSLTQELSAIGIQASTLKTLLSSEGKSTRLAATQITLQPFQTYIAQAETSR
ncbi:alpha-amylase family glycosyl hydrolase [soil metagenome]